MKTERKLFKGQLKAAGDEGSFEAIIATLNVIDSDGDIIVAGAFGDATVAVLPAHDSRSIPLGKAKMEDRGNSAVAVGQFNLDIQAAKEWHNALMFDLKNGNSIQEWSFAFRILDSEIETRDGEEVRILKKMDVMEVSPVLRGAGVGTGTIAAKSRFSDQLDETLTAVSDTLDRAEDIAKLRASKEKPKSISDEHKARLHKIVEKCTQLVGVLSDCDDIVDGDAISPEEKTLVDMAVRASQKHVAL